MKKKILLRTLILPLASVGITLGATLPLISCGCGNINNASSLYINYAGLTTISTPQGDGGQEYFEIYDNLDNPINNANLTYQYTSENGEILNGFSCIHFSSNQYKFQWTRQTKKDSYDIIIIAEANGLTCELEITLDITQQVPIEWVITNTGPNDNFNDFFEGTSPNATKRKSAFDTFLDENNVYKIIFEIDGFSIADSSPLANNGVFQGCNGLSEPDKPIEIEFKNNSLTTPISIGTYAFTGCSSITQITISGNLDIATIGNYAFFECVNLTGFANSSGSGKIKIASFGTGRSFSGCTSLKVDKINNDILDLANGTWTDGNDPNSGYWRRSTDDSLRYAGCLAIGSIVCPFTTLGSDAFTYCTNITEITNLPGALTSQTMLACWSLESIKFNSSTTVTTFATSTLAGCYVLHDIYLNGASVADSITFGTTPFRDCPNEGTIHGTDAQKLLNKIHAFNVDWLKDWTAVL